jgi:hypothetical protein
MPRRVAVLFEPGRGGIAALAHAARLVVEHPTELTVLALAPQERPPRCGGASPDAYNCAVLDQASRDLRQAAEQLGNAGEDARYRILIERRDPPIEAWIAENEFELVLLPARRRALASSRHPAAQRIRRHTPAEVRVISAGLG